MKPTIYFLFILLILLNSVKASNYYFSNAAGDDARTPIQAHNPATPWKTLNKLNSFMGSLQPGDSILFNRGETFADSINVTASGTFSLPIVFAAYGNGSKPVINGLTTFSNWTNMGSGIWETPCPSCGSSVNMVTINGQEYAMGRYPNKSAPNKGYRTFESHSAITQITDSTLAASPDWTGAELVIRVNRWVIDRDLITQHQGNNITYVSGSNEEPIDNFGYFVQNNINTLDQDGEWYYDANAKIMHVFFASGTPATYDIKASNVNSLISIFNQNNIVLDNLSFKGANLKSINLYNCQNISITNCEFLFSGMDAIDGAGTNKIKIENNSFSNTNNTAISLNWSCLNSSIRSNSIQNTGLLAGMGMSGDNQTYDGINISGQNNVIEYNTIDSVGYIPLGFDGDSILIKNNFINHFALTKDDAGGIYTWTGAGNPPSFGRKIEGNIILNGIGASEGSNSLDELLANGIYMDDNTSNVGILNNTVAFCGNAGLFLHNSNVTIARGNTLFDNKEQLLLQRQYGTCPGCSMQNNQLYNNIFFSKKTDQLVSDVESFAADAGSLATLDSNYYCRPLAENYDINVDTGQTGSVYDLQGWQTAYAMDPVSHISPFQIPYYTINNLIGTNKFANGNFNSDANGLYCYSPVGNCSTSWDNTGTLDTGSLEYSFTSAASNRSYLIIAAGAVSSSKSYILRFSMLGTKNNKEIGLFLRQSQSPYNNLTPVSYCKLNNSRSENEFLFSSPVTENDASIIFQIDEQDSTLWFDNIELFEANVAITNPDDYIRFEYNATQLVKNIPLSDTYCDVKNNVYSGNLSLLPFSSIVLIKMPVSTGIKSISDKTNTLTIYPNPSATILNISSSNNQLHYLNYQIYDVLGKLVMSKDIDVNKNENKFQLDISSFKNGMYFLNVNTNLKTCKMKFIKT